MYFIYKNDSYCQFDHELLKHVLKYILDKRATILYIFIAFGWIYSVSA